MKLDEHPSIGILAWARRSYGWIDPPATLEDERERESEEAKEFTT